MNSDYSVFDPSEVQKFLGQVAFQHANPTYLTLLDAPATLTGPAVTDLAPAAGPAQTPVRITGTGFTDDSVVDFGRVPVPVSDVTVDSPTLITATAPAGTGEVKVRVTNMIGTSPAVPQGNFTYS
ncbi:IPT/TIG domain-containing protein [Streptomyces sp. NPDC017890]|uniref:IPT/TIG domain-containing protein n=1 Tax=Streptomyces sp. NPDC017890 TaxID=3365015 RepID=UPI0037A84745